MGDIKPIEETTLAEWDRTVAIDQTGVFLGMKTAAPHLKTSEHASVVNISSIFGTSGGFGVSPAYHAAKGAVRTLTKNVALHWATDGVRVNSIHPGFIATPILEQSRNTAIWDGMTALTPMGNLGRPEDIAAGVAYLASDDAAFITGLELYIDGGYMARAEPPEHRDNGVRCSGRRCHVLGVGSGGDLSDTRWGKRSGLEDTNRCDHLQADPAATRLQRRTAPGRPGLATLPAAGGGLRG
jgi:hypothetical protein